MSNAVGYTEKGHEEKVLSDGIGGRTGVRSAGGTGRGRCKSSEDSTAGCAKVLEAGAPGVLLESI